MTSKNNRTLLLYHLKLCALIYSHWWIPTGVTVRKCLIGVKSVVLSACVALKFSTSKKKRAPIQCPSSFVHYFVAICEFKLVLQSGNAQFRSKSSIFWLTRPDRWPWNTTGCIFNATLSFVHNFRAICEFKLRLESGNAQFRSKSSILWCVRSWNLTNDLKNHRAPLLCHFKFCAPFCGHVWIQTRAMVWKWPNPAKFVLTNFSCELTNPL